MISCGKLESEILPKTEDDVVEGGSGFGSGSPWVEPKSARSLLEMYLPGTGASVWRFGVWFGGVEWCLVVEYG